MTWFKTTNLIIESFRWEIEPTGYKGEWEDVCYMKIAQTDKEVRISKWFIDRMLKSLKDVVSHQIGCQ
jgi:hypothetical protein